MTILVLTNPNSRIILVIKNKTSNNNINNNNNNHNHNNKNNERSLKVLAVVEEGLGSSGALWRFCRDSIMRFCTFIYDR